MNKLIPSLLAATAFTAAISAQQITVSVGTGWTVTPGCLQVVNNFSSNNGNGVILQGGASAEVGTDQCPQQYPTAGRASIQGYHNGTGSHSDGRQATAGRIEFYSRSTPANVDCTLNAQPIGATALRRGVGYSGGALGSVAVTCPLFGWQRASATADAVPPPAFPTMQTLPVSASGSATNVTSFQVNMSSGSRSWGTLTVLGDAIQLFAGASGTGTVTLY